MVNSVKTGMDTEEWKLKRDREILAIRLLVTFAQEVFKKWLGQKADYMDWGVNRSWGDRKDVGKIVSG